MLISYTIDEFATKQKLFGVGYWLIIVTILAIVNGIVMMVYKWYAFVK
jgi:hypothetical protein